MGVWRWREIETRGRREKGGKTKEGRWSTEKPGQRRRVRQAGSAGGAGFASAFLPSFCIEHLLRARTFPGAGIQHATKRRKNLPRGVYIV